MEPITPPRLPRPVGGWLVMRTDTMLIGDHERDLAVAALAQHYAHGRLTLTEHEDRMTRALKARTNADLLALFTDLPRPEAPKPLARRSRSRLVLRAIIGAIAALIVLIVVVQVIVVAAIVGAAVVIGRLAFASHRRHPMAEPPQRGWRATAGYRGW
jgi:hypothetical protein